MSKIREYAKTILGRDLTNEEVQAILAKHQALGLKETDTETALLDTVLLEMMVLQSIPEKIQASMDSVEQAAASKLTAAAAEIVQQSSGQLVEAFRQDFAAMTWNRAVWAVVVVLAVLGGSWIGGLGDIWWKQHRIQELQKKIDTLKTEKVALTKAPDNSQFQCAAGVGGKFVSAGFCIPVIVGPTIAPKLGTSTINGRTIYWARVDTQAVKYYLNKKS